MNCWHSARRCRSHRTTGIANPNSGQCSTWNTHFLISQEIHIRKVGGRKTCRRPKSSCFVAPPTFLAFFQPKDTSEEISGLRSAHPTPNSAIFALLPDHALRSSESPVAPEPVPTRPIRLIAGIRQLRASKHSPTALFPPPTLRID